MSIIELVEKFHQLDSMADNYGEIDWRFGAFAVIIEMAEAINELPWRPWRVSDHRLPTSEELARATDELADVICTAIRVSGQLGISGIELEHAIDAHIERKLQRLTDGIDH